jgi:CDP-paratose 2-epimerase
MAWNHIETTAGRVYNIGGGPENAISLLQLIHFLEHEVGPFRSVNFAKARPGDQLVYISDITKAKQDFGWQPNTNWVVGVRRLVEWVRENLDLCARMI